MIDAVIGLSRLQQWESRLGWEDLPECVISNLTEEDIYLERWISYPHDPLPLLVAEKLVVRRIISSIGRAVAGRHGHCEVIAAR